MDYEVGDIITYSPFGGGYRRVTVTAKEADVKNGRPGFDGDLIIHGGDAGGGGLGSSVWGYDDQIIAVERKEVV